MFWKSLHYSAGGKPGGKLARAIDESFGSFADFKEGFPKAAVTLFGAGWAWLCLDSDGKLHIITTPNQDNPISQGTVPLLGLDVWEHAYYLKYENRQAEYVDGWCNIVNWGYVSANFTVTNIKLGVLDGAAWAEDAWSKITSAFSGSTDE
jgi:Fe-Mn family superoxide dismutase